MTEELLGGWVHTVTDDPKPFRTAENIVKFKENMALICVPNMAVVNLMSNDFAMDGRGNFTKATKRLTPDGWVGKIVYEHINKRGRMVVHRVERIKDQSHG